MNQQLQKITLQQMFKVPASGMNTRSQSSTPLINHIINDRLLPATPRFSTDAARFTQLLQEIIYSSKFPTLFRKFFN